MIVPLLVLPVVSRKKCNQLELQCKIVFRVPSEEGIDIWKITSTRTLEFLKKTDLQTSCSLLESKAVIKPSFATPVSSRNVPQEFDRVSSKEDSQEAIFHFKT